MVTPVQLARMIAAVASGGTLIRPHLLKNATGLAGRIIFRFPTTRSQQITDGIYGVVERSRTARHPERSSCRISISPARPAPRKWRASICRHKLGKKLKENGWFVGFAPRRNPEIVVAALVQGGGWGSLGRADRPRRRQSVLRQEKREFPCPHRRNGDLAECDPAPAAVPARSSSLVARRSAAPVKDRPSIQRFRLGPHGHRRRHLHDRRLEIYSSTHASAMAGMQWRQLMLDRRRHRRDVHHFPHRLSHPAGSGSDSLYRRHRGTSRGSGIGYSRLGAKRWISIGGDEFASVRTHEVDYNHRVRALLYGSAHRSADASRS